MTKITTIGPQLINNFSQPPQSQFNLPTLVEILRYRAEHQPQQKAFVFLKNGEEESSSLTYQELDFKARAIAAQLQQLKARNERALLLYQLNLEFIAAFFGCLYAGVVAVPAYPPRPNRSIERIRAIRDNAQAQFALTDTYILKKLENSSTKDELASLHWLATDTINSNLAQTWQKPKLSSDTLAFLQYTSGSTGTPKGVMVTHGNLLHNLSLIQQGFEHRNRTIGVTWLPVYHDMGLIGGILQPVYAGFLMVSMSPVDFLQKPIRWLQAISDYQATTSGGPNFAYDLILRKITPPTLARLDLSSWDVAVSGAEPVRAETIERFAHTFAPCGFRFEAFYPCYGMAESTLIITGGIKSQLPVIKTVDSVALERNQLVSINQEPQSARKLVGVGKPLSELKVVIVDPNSHRECPINCVGEIWVSGPSVAQGYWQQFPLTEQTFGAYITDTGSGPFLRTGDLGFLDEDGELFVTGRLKDIIIIRGRNHYPQDIELTVEQSYPALIPHRSAAFSVEVGGKEKLVVVVEVERRFEKWFKNEEKNQKRREKLIKQFDRRSEHIDPGFEVSLERPLEMDAAISSIRQAVAKNHGIQVYAILLLRVGSIPKTSSGKIQRYACRNGFLNGELMAVGGDFHLMATNESVQI
ncbi:MAG: fatty acyl-AMP ligase [Xenococcaceae cyanobacterium]